MSGATSSGPTGNPGAVDLRAGGLRSGEERPPIEPIESEASLGQLIARLGSDLGDLLSSQVELAKVELRDEASATARAGSLLAAGGVLGHLALALLLVTVAFVLDEFLPTWAAFGIVTVVVAVVAAVLALAGRKRLAGRDPLAQTRRTLHDDTTEIPRRAQEELAWNAPPTN